MAVKLVAETSFLRIVPVGFVSPLRRAHIAIKVSDCDGLVSQELGRSNLREFSFGLLASFSCSIIATKSGRPGATELGAEM